MMKGNWVPRKSCSDGNCMGRGDPSGVVREEGKKK